MDEENSILNEEVRFKIKPAICPTPDTSCSDKLCPRKITLGESCYWDMLAADFLCVHCGRCLRYARKKAVQRGAPIESAEV